MLRIGFICTSNSARSQMAEGLALWHSARNRHKILIYSAGSAPAGYVHPLAIRAMAELHIDISRYSSKTLADIPCGQLGYIITLCGDAAEHCPYVPGAVNEHWELPDPVQVVGSEEVRLRAFYQVRDVLNERIAELVSRLTEVARSA